MRAGAGLLLVMLGLFVIYLGVTGKLLRLGDSLSVLTGRADVTPLGGATDTTVRPASTVPHGVTAGSVSLVPSLGQLFGSSTAVPVS